MLERAELRLRVEGLFEVWVAMLFLHPQSLKLGCNLELLPDWSVLGESMCLAHLPL